MLWNRASQSPQPAQPARRFAPPRGPVWARHLAGAATRRTEQRCSPDGPRAGDYGRPLPVL